MSIWLRSFRLPANEFFNNLTNQKVRRPYRPARRGAGEAQDIDCRVRAELALHRWGGQIHWTGGRHRHGADSVSGDYIDIGIWRGLASPRHFFAHGTKNQAKLHLSSFDESTQDFAFVIPTTGVQ